jgi:hypothetical protein
MSLIKHRETVIINQSLATSSLFTFNVLQNVQFQPKYMIIRQILYSNIAGTDSGTYLLWSNVTSSYIGAFYIGIQGVVSMPESIIKFPTYFSTIDFRIDRANSAFNNPSGQLTITIEFVKDE